MVQRIWQYTYTGTKSYCVNSQYIYAIGFTNILPECYSTLNYTYANFNIEYIMYNVQDYSLLYNTVQFTCLYVRLGVLLTRRKHIDDRIISLSWEVCVDKTSLTHHFFFKCLFQNRKVSDHVCVLRVSILPYLVVLKLFRMCVIFCLF